MNEEVPKMESGQDQNDEWIVQSKPRRLVPQHSLSKQDLDSDKNKTAAVSGDAKKKVTRFTKEEMMTFRQPVNILGFMADMTDVISTERLNPVCFERFEPEDVIRIWNTDKTGPGGKGGEGRGRGRGKPGFKPDEAQGEQMPSEWNNTRESGNNNKGGGLWDDATGGDGAAADGLDLEDFAAMALKFRSEMEQMKLNGEGGEAAAIIEDPMTALVGEQVRRLGGFEVEDDEPLPDWAADIAAQAVAPQPAAKRSLLLDTLNVKPQTATVVSHTTTMSGALDLSVTQSMQAKSVLSTSLPPQLTHVERTEWLYTDPQGQVQGPFEQENMRQWHEAGYFNADLPIKLRHWQRFHTFQVVFPDFKLAFLTVPQEPGSLLLSVQQQQHAQQQALLRQQQQQIEEQRQKLEQEQRQLELQRQQEQQRQLELQRQQQEQQKQKELAMQQQQQAEQLLQQQQAAAAAEQERQRVLAEQERQQAAAPAPVSPAKPATVAPWANKQPGPKRGTAGESLTSIQNAEQAARDEERKKQAAEQAKVAKGWTTTNTTAPALSLAEIQQQEKEARQRQQAEVAKTSAAAAPATTSMSSQLKNLLGVKTAAAPTPVSSGPAWGGSAAAAPASKGSLRDIMKEENSGRPEAESSTGTRSAGSVAKPMSWASKAGSSTFTAVPEPVPVAPKIVQRLVPPPPAPAATVTTAVRPSAKPAATVSAKESFGGKDMSKDMADWCTVQLKRLNGSDDLTLVQFCMSLDSAVEIRQYLSEYLGSSPAVTNFATDFIKYKEGGRKAIDSGSLLSSVGAVDSTRTSSANANNPSGFVNAGKKKRGGK